MYMYMIRTPVENHGTLPSGHVFLFKILKQSFGFSLDTFSYSLYVVDRKIMMSHRAYYKVLTKKKFYKS